MYKLLSTDSNSPNFKNNLKQEILLYHSSAEGLVVGSDVHPVTGKLGEVMRTCCFPRTVVWQIFPKKDVSRAGNEMDLQKLYQDQVWKKMAEMFTYKFGKTTTNLSRKCTKLLSRRSLLPRQTFYDLDYPYSSNTHEVHCRQMAPQEVLT